MTASANSELLRSWKRWGLCRLLSGLHPITANGELIGARKQTARDGGSKSATRCCDADAFRSLDSLGHIEITNGRKLGMLTSDFLLFASLARVGLNLDDYKVSRLCTLFTHYSPSDRPNSHLLHHHHGPVHLHP